jgi:hypothetical protein
MDGCSISSSNFYPSAAGFDKAVFVFVMLVVVVVCYALL